MVVTLADIYQFYTGSSSVRNRAFAAVLIAADGVMSEPADTLNHAARLVWAREALNNPGGVRDQMWAAVATTNSIVTAGEACTDLAIKNAIATRLNEMAAANTPA